MIRPKAPTRRVNPVAVLIVCAIVPAVLFGAIWQWADSHRIALPSGPVVVETPLATPSRTPVLSLRRAPQTLAISASRDAFAAALIPVSKMLIGNSCLQVSVAGRTILDYGAGLAVTPASNLKVLLASVALEVLGPDYAFTTSLKGMASAGIIAGDLYMVGGGDPLLSTANYPSTQKYPPTNTTSLETLVSDLVAAGITQVQGNVVGDDSRYDSERFSAAWGSGVVGVEAGPLGALMVNDASRAATGNAGARYSDPAAGAATDLISLLRAAGITVGGTATTGTAPADLAVLASVTSAPLTAVLTEMLTNSDNNTAELLLKELGVHAGNAGSRQAGADVMMLTLTARGLDTSQLLIHDGSGLDAADKATCALMVQVLQHEGLDSAIGAALPIAGRTGTLTDEFSGTDAVGRMHAKTGSLRNTKSLSGFVENKAGNITFSLLLNFANARDPNNFRPIWSALQSALNTYPSGPDPATLQPR